ncbi:MAG: T9SS type A sorting domain-containing protein [bacterium]
MNWRILNVKAAVMFTPLIWLGLPLVSSAQTDFFAQGGFETANRPHLWHRMTTGTTAAQVEWATDKARSVDRSAKITKSDQNGEAAWVSDNMNQYWTRTWGAGAGGNDDLGGFAPGQLLEVGGWVQTESVNTNPAADNETIYLAFSMYDSTGGLIFGQDIVVPLPQDQATVGTWTEIKSDPFELPVRSDSVIIAFKFGSNATGTAWADDVFLRRVDPTTGTWEGDIFNNSFNAPEGWFYWWMDFIRGDIPITATISDDDVHSGTYALKIIEEDNESDEVVFISDHLPIDASSDYILSAWVKTVDFSADSAAVNNGFRIGFTVNWHSSAPGWHEIGGADLQFEVADSTTDWTLYAMSLTPPAEATHATVRARYWNFATGTSYWDDFALTKVSDVTNALSNNGFDGATKPHLWNTMTTGTTAAQVEWATDKARSVDRSAKITKSDQNGEAAWVSDNMNQYWTRTWGAGAGGNDDLGGFAPGQLLEVGGWVQTESVNTNPAADNETIYLAFSMYDSTGGLIFGQDIVVPLPQDQATVGTWTEIKSDPFELPVRSDSVIIAFKFGSNATGTAWADDVFLRRVDPTTGTWEGDIFNNSFNAPEGWFYWWMDFIRGDIPITATISDDDVHSGTYALKIVEEDNESDEVVFISDHTPIDASTDYVLSAWVKTVDFSADSAAVNNGFRIGFTVNWHSSAPGWHEIGGADMQFDVADSTTDWTLYAMPLTPPAEATHATVRARYWNFATGTSYWDDFALTPVVLTSVEELGPVTDNGRGGVPGGFDLAQNYPNPFNPQTTIEYKVTRAGHVIVDIYNLLGQKVRTLIDEPQTAGRYRVMWNGFDDRGNTVSSGIYLYRLQIADQMVVKKMTFIK